MNGHAHLNQDLAGKRIFVGPVDIAGSGSRIANALAEGGANVLFYNGQDHLFNPQLIEVPRLHRLFRGGIATAARLRKMGISGKIAGAILANCIKVSAFVVACSWADVCVFIGGQGILTHSAEYVLLRLLGKRVIHMFVGTASRPRYMSGYARDVFLDGSIDKRRLQNLVRHPHFLRRLGGQRDANGVADPFHLGIPSPNLVSVREKSALATAASRWAT